MKLSNVIFSDGTIVKLSQSGDSLSISFRDYCDKLLEITLTGGVRFDAAECIGFEVHSARLQRQGDKQTLQLFDDDKQCVFRATFEQSEVLLRTG